MGQMKLSDRTIGQRDHQLNLSRSESGIQSVIQDRALISSLGTEAVTKVNCRLVDQIEILISIQRFTTEYSKPKTVFVYPLILFKQTSKKLQFLPSRGLAGKFHRPDCMSFFRNENKCNQLFENLVDKSRLTLSRSTHVISVKRCSGVAPKRRMS